MRAKLFMLLMFFFVSLCVGAQTTIKGTVLDGAQNNEPLIGAAIQVPGTGNGTVTDLDGHFSFVLPAGKTMIQVGAQ